MKHKHMFYVDSPHSESFAAGVLLRKQLRMHEVQRWLDTRMEYLTRIESEKGFLSCFYCSSNNLLKQIEEPVTKSKLKLLATIDHIHPVSKGGEVWDESNWVVACHPCNQNKADRLLTDAT